VTGAPAPDDAAARDLACRKLAAAAGSALGQAATNAFGTPGAFVWGQTGLNGGGGAAAALAARAGVLPEGAVLAAAARDWLLGRNPWGASFVVGYGRRPARDPHHWARVIRRGEPVGAVVGGPAARSLIAEQGLKTPRGVFDSAAATYEDRAADYVTSEPALWYTAVSVLLLAALAPAG
jgi:hypothetical protein